MVGIKLKDFQQECVEKIINATVTGNKKEILINSPTGSGKTIILIDYIDEFLKENKNTVFIWFTPGAGELEEQSRKKMQKYLHMRTTKNITDVLTTGFEPGDTAFINWEVVTNKKNTALKEQERKNLFERIVEAKNNGLEFIVIIDEEHKNKTDKADAIIQEFKSDYIIRVSATTKTNKEAENIEISEIDVINSGLITRALYINEGIEDSKLVNDETEYVLDLAINKQDEIRQECLKKGVHYNPLVIIQFPNSSSILIKKVEKYLETKNIKYDNNSLAIWMSDRPKQNVENLTDNMSEISFLLMKQAISTGWDCPRAKVLVKLRENMNEDFEIQTLGRIRRMPQAKHYDNVILDNCYLYTFDEKYKIAVKQELGNSASDVKLVFLKNEEEYKKVRLIKELKDNENDGFAVRQAYKIIYSHYMSKYKLSNKKAENKKVLESSGYNFNPNLISNIAQGKVVEINKDELDIDKIKVESKVDTHKNGLELRHSIGVISSKTGMKYDKTRPILDRLFLGLILAIGDKKILSLNRKEYYAFIINNEEKIKDDFREAVSQHSLQISMKDKKEVSFRFPDMMIVKYDSEAKNDSIRKLNIYNDYPSSAKRSKSEVKFERFCEKSGQVKWWYKNGESSQDFFSLVYNDAVGKQWLFYPDYIIKDNNDNIWIIETKGGEDKSGNSKNIDIKIENKYEVLKNYSIKHNIKWGFVRDSDKDDEIYISFADKYIEDMKDESWINVENIIGK